MLHYFIVNPTAGVKNALPSLKEEIARIFENRSDKYEIYETKCENDATIQIKRILQERDLNDPSMHIRIYSAGGDGTAFECANGLVGYQNTSFAILPTGSCNDFLKSFKDSDFSNLESVVNADAYPMDVLKVNDKICVNVCNIGYDAKTNDDCMRFRKKMKSVHHAYVLALAINLLKPLGDKVIIKNEDNKVIFEGKSLLLALCNGEYYGGSYRCAPLAVQDDGLMEVSIVKKVSRLTFLRLVGGYKKGEHITNYEKYKKYCVYDRAKSVTISSDNPLTISIDGEIFRNKDVKIEVLKHAVNFVIPSNK